MSIEKKNAEGYSDPTPFLAITNIVAEEQTTAPPLRRRCYMPRVYICSPYASDPEGNAAKARKYCAYAVKAGYIPFAPHLFFPQFLNDGNSEERDIGIFMGTVFLDGCAEVWVFGDVISEGMTMEIARAKKRGITLRYFNESCEEVFHHV